jgi:hypothetical protein
VPRVADDELWIPVDKSAWFNLHAESIMFAISLPMGLALLGAPASVVLGGMLTCATAVAWFMVRRFRRGVGLLLTPTELTAKGVFITRSSPWSDVSHVTIGRNRRLYPAATFFSRPELHAWEITSPPMTIDSTREVGPYLERHGLGHLLRQPSNPATKPFPTTDSLRPYDPVEALQSIRRATVGDRVIRVRALADGFRAETTDHAGTEVFEVGNLRSTLAAATDDAILQVELARNQPTSG